MIPVTHALLLMLAAAHSVGLLVVPHSRQTKALSTATLSGVVVTEGPAAVPVRRAVVVLSGPALPFERSTVTGDDGLFEFSAVPAGIYSIKAVRAGYLSIPYGATKPGRPGVSVVVRAGQNLDGIRLLLSKGSVVTGRVTDSAGVPLTIIPVALEHRDRTGAWRQAGESVTDGHGTYRFFGLSPGEYVVKAVPPLLPLTATRDQGDSNKSPLEIVQENIRARQLIQASAARNDPEMPRFVPIYSPSSTMRDGALRILLRDGEEYAGVDITLTPVRTTKLSGLVVPLPGTRPSSVDVRLSAGGDGVPTLRLVQSIDAEGRFSFGGLVPGRYRLVARSAASEGAPRGFAVAEVSAAGADLEGIQLTLQPVPAISGRLVLAPDNLTPSPGTFTIQLLETPVPIGKRELSQPRGRYTAKLAADGTFRLSDLDSGTYYVDAYSQLDRSWWVTSVVVDGVEVTDKAIDVQTGSGASMTLTITMTNQVSTLEGSLIGLTGLPATDYTVVVFSSDRAHWSPPFRRIRVSRPSTDGRFEFAGMLPGDYYLAVLVDVDPDDCSEASFLETLVAMAVRVNVRIGTRTVQELRVMK